MKGGIHRLFFWLAIFFSSIACIIGCPAETAQKNTETAKSDLPLQSEPAPPAPSRNMEVKATPGKGPEKNLRVSGKTTLSAPVPDQSPAPEEPGPELATVLPDKEGFIHVTRLHIAAMSKGVPSGWVLDRKKGKPSLELIEGQDQNYCFRLKSRGDSFGFKKAVPLNIREYPYLNWKWKVFQFPKEGDVRKKSTDDQALQIYIAFPSRGWPESLNTPIIGYIWDNECPKDWSGRSPQAGGAKLRYIVLRNKADQPNTLYSEKRNVYEDYRRLFPDLNGGEPTGPIQGVEFYINSQHTKSQAEGQICEMFFSKN